MIESKGKNGLPEKQALSTVKGVLAGLDCAHRLAILHRDVKSSNVLVDRSGRARLTDFGIAMQAGGPGASQGANVMGTPAYMSPEQLRNSADIDHRSDVYSAGVVLFEALTGRLPFTGETFEAVQLSRWRMLRRIRAGSIRRSAVAWPKSYGARCASIRPNAFKAAAHS